MRLDKYISNNTEYSRSTVVKFIKKGFVKVDGETIFDNSLDLDFRKHKVLLDDIEIKEIGYAYIVLNKPYGFVCSNSNIDGESILNLLGDDVLNKDLHIVGRLDKDTTGLVLITNDGEFTHYIKKPNSNIEKEYVVTLEKEFTREMNNKLKKPIRLDGKQLKPFKIYKISKNTLNIILTEGKYHQIKRIFEIVGNRVISLKRIRIGKFNLGNNKIDIGDYKIIKKDDLI